MFLLIALVLLRTGSSQITEYRQGQILDSLPVTTSPGETFALYLPKDHDPKNLSSVLFIFDPAGRGSTGLQPFIAGAEQYNYILICSNNSRNGPYETGLGIAERLFNHVFSHFKIDEQRIYTAGFSGGSRLAATIAILSDRIQGVIGCGAGFSLNTNYIPSPKDSFSYAGLVGDRDMNYQEMMKAGRWLTTMNIENEIYTYEDGHNWPPATQLLRAFGWLELQAYKKGIKERDDRVIQRVFSDEISRVRPLENDGMIPDVVMEYERAIRNFSAFLTLDSISAKVTELKKSRAYKQAFKDISRVARLEDTLTSRFGRRFSEEESRAKSTDNFNWWKKQLKRLDETYVDSDRKILQKMGERLRYQLFALAIESFEGHVRNNRREKALYCSEFLMVQGPNNPFFHFRLALGFARLGQKEESMVHLEAALKNGWKDIERLHDAEEFRDLRKDPRFTHLLDKFG